MTDQRVAPMRLETIRGPTRVATRATLELLEIAVGVAAVSLDHARAHLVPAVEEACVGFGGSAARDAAALPARSFCLLGGVGIRGFVPSREVPSGGAPADLAACGLLASCVEEGGW